MQSNLRGWANSKSGFGDINIADNNLAYNFENFYEFENFYLRVN